MVRTRTFLIKPAHAGRREQYARQFAQYHAKNPRPSVIQYPSIASTPVSATSLITTEASSDGSSSPDSIMDSSPSSETALVRIFDVNNPLLMLLTVLGSPLLRTLYCLILGPAAQQLPAPCIDDLIPDVDSGVHSFKLRPVLAHQYRRIFDTLAGIILCAANNHNPWVLGGGPQIPAGIPLRSLLEIDSRVPAICLFRVYARLTFEERRFSTIAEGLEHIAMLQKICRHFIFFIANGIRLSIEDGYHSGWNYGAPLGMAEVEFRHRATPTFSYGGYSDLAVHMRNRAEQSEIDFACARLVSPNASQLIFTEHATDPLEPICYVAAWPLPDEQQSVLTSGESVNKIVKLTLADDELDNINQHLQQLALHSEEDSMEIDPVVI
ncbi:hypothetical protein B0H13DRAFT_2312633 [Mycena leptocephala]|nr:hypothetical protein B0H13DRAFT_2312633 [Mycena leptocephala]